MSFDDAHISATYRNALEWKPLWLPGSCSCFWRFHCIHLVMHFSLCPPKFPPRCTRWAIATVRGAEDAADSAAMVAAAAAAGVSSASNDDDDDEYHLNMMNCTRSFVTHRPDHSSPSGGRCQHNDVRPRIAFGSWQVEA